LNYLSIENSIFNYATINLLSTKRLTLNLINSFVKKFQYLIKIYIKKLLETRKSKSTEKWNWTKEMHF